MSAGKHGLALVDVDALDEAAHVLSEVIGMGSAISLPLGVISRLMQVRRRLRIEIAMARCSR